MIRLNLKPSHEISLVNWFLTMKLDFVDSMVDQLRAVK